jgi:Flp pilus assembly protein TadD
VQVGLHVNVVVRLRDGKRYMVDIDPLPSRDISASRELTDAQGEALYYNNIAMAALAEGETETAWLYVVRALQLSPEDSHLWANLGAVYRSSGQHREAEQSYMQALELDFTEYSAMTNLAVLYGLEGRDEERDYWLERVEIHRRSNPYYHAWLGDEVAAAGDWAAALDHYEQAVALSPSDSNLLFSRGVIHYQLRDYDAAARDIEEAINLATLHSDIAYYQRQLEAVREARLVGI